jgi:hypothetical protein
MAPMNARLLRPIANNLDPDAAVYLNAVAVADGQQLEPAVRKAINDFVLGCKRDGIWSAFKTAGILMGARTLSGALTPLVGTAPTNNNFVSGDYNRKTGLVGNASNKSLTLPFNGGDVGQNDIHAAVWVSTAASPSFGNFPTYIGAGSSQSGSSVIGRLENNGQLYIQSRTSTASFVANNTGFIGHNRSSSSEFVYRLGGSNTTVSRTSQSAYTANNFSVFRDLHTNIAFSNSRQSFYSAGSSIDLALLNSRVSTLEAAIGAAI